LMCLRKRGRYNMRCVIEGCPNEGFKSGYCNKHTQQLAKHGRILSDNCEIDGCGRKRYKMFYCRRHFEQYKRHGKIIRKVLDFNEIIVIGEYAEMLLHDKYGFEVARTKISVEDIERVKTKKWHYDRYVRNNEGVMLHRFVMNCIDPNKQVDHIFHDKLDNRREFLKICTSMENNQNAPIGKRNKSGVKGVHWCKWKSKWKVEVVREGKRIFVGWFNDFDLAVKEREKVVESYGKI